MEPDFIPCLWCGHYLSDPHLDLCRAFPDGIPDEFIFAEKLHETPVPGQVGDFIYSPRKGAPGPDEFVPCPDQQDLVGLNFRVNPRK